MPKGKPPIPTRRPAAPQKPRSILELDRFSETTLQQWNAASRDLDELEDVLYFGLEPERRRLHHELIAALQEIPLTPVNLQRWARVVTYQYSLEPLSSAGSLQNIGVGSMRALSLMQTHLILGPRSTLRRTMKLLFERNSKFPVTV